MENKEKIIEYILEVLQKNASNLEKNLKDKAFKTVIYRDELSVTSVDLNFENCYSEYDGSLKEQIEGCLFSALEDYLIEGIDLSKISLVENKKDKVNQMDIESIKKIITANIISENIELWQSEFKDELVKELKGVDPNKNVEDIENIGNQISKFLEYQTFYKAINQANASIISQVLVKCISENLKKELNRVLEEYTSDIERLQNLSKVEVNKFNEYIEEEEDYSYGKNVDERIEKLKQTKNEIIEINDNFEKIINSISSSYVETGTYGQGLSYDVDVPKNLIQMDKMNYDYMVSKAYPNGIMDGEKYKSEVINDSIDIVKYTQTYMDMLSDQQDEVIIQLSGLASRKQK